MNLHFKNMNSGPKYSSSFNKQQNLARTWTGRVGDSTDAWTSDAEAATSFDRVDVAMR